MSILIILKNRIKIPFNKTEDYIAFSFILVWLYGVITGIIYGNKIEYVVANFAGMVCYISYFLFTTFNINKKLLIKVVFLAGLSVSIIAILRVVCFLMNVQNPIITTLVGEGVGMSSTGQIRVYFTTLAVAYPLLGSSLFVLLYRYHKVNMLKINLLLCAFVYFVITISATMFISSSKGFLLGGLFLIVSIPFFISVRRFLIGKLNPALFILLIIASLILFFLLYFDYFSIIEMMFAKEDSSNTLRYQQLTYLMDDISFFGHGLGSTVPGVIRSDEGPYGFELTYINLIHKFGVFSIVLFFNWLYMFIKLFSFLMKKKSLFYSSVAISSLGYMFPSIGNPLLMHPSLVILNCLTLYIIRIEK